MIKVNHFFVVISCVLLFVTTIKAAGHGYPELVLLEDHPLDSACLDGSPYGYFYRQGTEPGKFLIFHHGGGWCFNVSMTDCAERANGPLGSSTKWGNYSISDYAILSSNATVNPYLYNWTLAWLWYCDGSSFTSYRQSPVAYKNQKLYFKGQRNLMAAAQDLLLNKGLRNATDVIIGGSSAGGLATYIHLDLWASYVPNATTVRGLPDGGWFLDTNSFYGYSIYTPEMQFAYEMFNSSAGVNQDCLAYPIVIFFAKIHILTAHKYHTKTGDTWKCFMAEFTYPFIKTPLFMVNSKYDKWQMANVYELPCFANLKNCNATEMTDFLNYGKTFLATVPPIVQNTKDGMFVDACYTHTETMTSDNAWVKTMIADSNGVKVPICEAFNRWYNGEDIKLIETCTYPCNPTCPRG